MLAFISALCVLLGFAHADPHVIEVVRVQDIIPLLESLMSSGASNIQENIQDSIKGAADHFAEFVPKGNLQGTMSSSINSLLQTVQAPLATGSTGTATMIKGVGKQIPMIHEVGSMFPNLSTFTGLKESPEVPTLAPITPPEEAARMAADLGIKTAATKNTLKALASMPGHVIASRANQIGSAFENGSSTLLATPNQINQLLQFQHSLFASYLAGMDEATTAVSPQTLRDEIMKLSKFQPSLKKLLPHLDNPAAAGPMGSLSKMFGVLKAVGVTGAADAGAQATEAAESLLVDPFNMQLAVANVALNFLESISPIEA